MSDLQTLAEHISAGLDGKLAGYSMAFGELTLDVNPGNIEPVLRFCATTLIALSRN